ncbi:MAG: phosphatidate cytidylyltransferase [Pyrinomonadaceae bacterium]
MARILTAVIALPVLIASIWWAALAPIFVALAAAAMMLGLYEFYLLAGKLQIKADVSVGTLFAAAVLIICYFNELAWLPIVVAAFVIVSLAAAMLRRGASFDRMIAATGATLLGVLYVALLGGHLIALRTGFAQDSSAKLLSLFFLILMGSDTAAYYTGRAFGRHKLAPSISPGKTWEGAVGGMAASLLAVIVARSWFFPELRLEVGLPLAAAMNVLGVIGDLTESALKRGAGAKDAAHILPGHGGLLDRLDSLLFNAPVIYYFGLLYLG